MAVPKRRRTSSRRDMRRSQHDKVGAPNLIPCPSCSSPILPHRVCGSCGAYKGKQVLISAEADAESAAAAEG